MRAVRTVRTVTRMRTVSRVTASASTVIRYYEIAGANASADLAENFVSACRPIRCDGALGGTGTKQRG